MGGRRSRVREKLPAFRTRVGRYRPICNRASQQRPTSLEVEFELTAPSVLGEHPRFEVIDK